MADWLTKSNSAADDLKRLIQASMHRLIAYDCLRRFYQILHRISWDRHQTPRHKAAETAGLRTFIDLGDWR